VLFEQAGHLAGDLDAPGAHHDQVVTGSLEFGDRMGREDDADAVVRHRSHELAHELVTGQRVEFRDGFVEQQEVGPLGQRHAERHLRLLPAGELTDPALERDAEAREAGMGIVVVPARVHRAPEVQHLTDPKGAVQRRRLRQESDARQAARVGRRGSAEQADRP
jgi:hypothetical protein